MDRKLTALGLAAILAGSGFAGCGAGSGADVPSSARVTAAVRSSAHDMDPEKPMDTDAERDAAVSRFMGLLNQLRELPALAPLLEEYQIVYPVVIEDDVRSAGLIDLLRAVRITVVSGVVYVTNRATGAMIYAAPSSDLANGALDPANLPTTGGTPPAAVTCTSFTWSAWGACQPDGTQTRTVTASSPTGCTGGTPVPSRRCTYAARNPFTNVP